MDPGSVSDVLLQQPLFFAAVATPLLVKLLCIVKYRAPATPFSATPPPTPTPAAKKPAKPQKPTPPAASPKPAKTPASPDTPDTPEKKRRLVSFKNFCRALYWISLLTFAALACSIVYVVVEWKGASVIFPSLAVLFVTVRWTNRPAIILDALITVVIICLLSGLSTLSNASMGQNVIVSLDPTHHHACRTIQEGIDSVSEGGSIRVFPGVYTEEVIIQKNIVLMGVGASPGDTVLKLPEGLAQAARSVAPTGQCAAEGCRGGHDGAVMKITSDSIIRNIRLEAASPSASASASTPAARRAGASGGSGKGAAEGQEGETGQGGSLPLVTPSSVEGGCRPLVYLGDTFLGASLIDVEIACSGVCLLGMASHPFLQHALENVTFVDVLGAGGGVAGAESLGEKATVTTRIDTHMQGINVQGERVFGCITSPSVASALASLSKHTEAHTATTVLLLKWIDVSAHWAVEAYKFSKDHVFPVLLDYWEVAKVGLDVVAMWGASFLCGITNTNALCPSVGPIEPMYTFGRSLYDFIGVFFVQLYHYVALLMSRIADGLLFLVENALLPCVASVMQTVPLLGWSILSHYLLSSQVIQVGVHIAWLIGTAAYSFSGNWSSLFGGGMFLATIEISKNLPTLVPLAVEYLMSLFVIFSVWGVLPILLPFVHVYVTMLVVHVGVPIQGNYSLLKRFANGKYDKRIYHVLMFFVRAVVSLQPSAVFSITFLLLGALRMLARSDSEEKKPAEEDPKALKSAPTPTVAKPPQGDAGKTSQDAEKKTSEGVGKK